MFVYQKPPCNKHNFFCFVLVSNRQETDEAENNLSGKRRRCVFRPSHSDDRSEISPQKSHQCAQHTDKLKFLQFFHTCCVGHTYKNSMLLSVTQNHCIHVERTKTSFVFIAVGFLSRNFENWKKQASSKFKL